MTNDHERALTSDAGALVIAAIREEIEAVKPWAKSQTAQVIVAMLEHRLTIRERSVARRGLCGLCDIGLPVSDDGEHWFGDGLVRCRKARP